MSQMIEIFDRALAFQGEVWVVLLIMLNSFNRILGRIPSAIH
jgi:hypothetical protein